MKQNKTLFRELGSKLSYLFWSIYDRILIIVNFEKTKLECNVESSISCYADEVAAIEAIRIADFKKEKQSYQEEIKNLKKTNRQLVKDVAFYKKAHEELANNEPIVATVSNSPGKRQSHTSESESQTVASSLRPNVGKQKSSKEVAKINLSLFEENKKLQSKICDIRSTVALLKTKNKQLENFRSKIENKKSKFCRDAEELELMIDLSETKNKDKYTPRVLDMLGNLAKYKRV